ncbi:MAG: zinc ribbon domain-containing protein [Acidimicrobiales bacterium]
MTDPAQAQLLVVQGFDTTLLQLAHKHANHPLRAELAAVQAELAPMLAEAVEIEARRHEVERARKRLDDEVAGVEARRGEIDAKLYDGSVTATKDLLALQDEAAQLLERQRSMEDDELELMEQIEEADGELAAAAERRRSTEERITALEAELAVALDGVAAEQATTEAERSDAAASVTPDVLTRYDRLREDLGGVAVARLVGSTCDGCHMSLSAVQLDEIKREPEDAVVHCEECGRILVR